LLQVSNDCQERLSCREGIAEGVVRPVLGNSRETGELPKRQETRGGFTALGDEQAADGICVQYRFAQT
jgi:hypothetical protein